MVVISRRVVLICSAVLALSPSLTYAKNEHQVVNSIRLEIGMSDDMKYRADNIPESKGLHVFSNSRPSGFARNGNYGKQELDYLKTKFRKKLNKRFTKSGIEIHDASANTARYTLAIMIVDAKNNNPTPQQRRRSINLIDGAQIGGATIISKLTLSSDPAKFKVYAIKEYGRGGDSLIWSDSLHAFDRFAKKITKEISSNDLKLDGETVVF